MGSVGAAHAWGGGRNTPPPVALISHTYHKMMKLGTVIPCLKKIQKIYESRDTPPDFTGNQQILLYQEIQTQIVF